VNELVGEDLPGCESSYETSIIMLEALLEPISFDLDPDAPAESTLDEEDRLTIERCTDSKQPWLMYSRPKYSQASGDASKETRYCISTQLPDTFTRQEATKFW